MRSTKGLHCDPWCSLTGSEPTSNHGQTCSDESYWWCLWHMFRMCCAWLQCVSELVCKSNCSSRRFISFHLHHTPSRAQSISCASTPTWWTLSGEPLGARVSQAHLALRCWAFGSLWTLIVSYHRAGGNHSRTSGHCFMRTPRTRISPRSHQKLSLSQGRFTNLC